MTAAEIAAVAVPAAAALGTPIGLGLRALAKALLSVARELKELRVKVEVLADRSPRVVPRKRQAEDAA